MSTAEIIMLVCGVFGGLVSVLTLVTVVYKAGQQQQVLESLKTNFEHFQQFHERQLAEVFSRLNAAELKIAGLQATAGE